MLFNQETKTVQKNSDCLTCVWFDRKKKKCNGIGKICFEFDEKAKIAIDPVTRLPIKLN